MALGFVLIFGSIAITQLGDKGGAEHQEAAESAPDASADAANGSTPNSHQRKRNRGRIAR